MSAVKAGICVNLPIANTRHLFIVLNDPIGDPPLVALVNFTTHKDGLDETVVIEAGDANGHSFVKQKTIVNYAQPLIVKADALDRAIRADLNMRHREDCCPELLARIRAGVFTSRFVKPKLKTFCEGKF